jgi:hypothetical protein
VRGEPILIFLRGLFTNISWLFTCLLLIFIWWLMYPKHSSESDE